MLETLHLDQERHLEIVISQPHNLSLNKANPSCHSMNQGDFAECVWRVQVTSFPRLRDLEEVALLTESPDPLSRWRAQGCPGQPRARATPVCTDSRRQPAASQSLTDHSKPASGSFLFSPSDSHHPLRFVGCVTSTF